MSAGKDNGDLYMMVGEIRSDVKSLLKQSASQDERIGSLEKGRWVAAGTLSILAMLVGPALAKVLGISG